MRRLPIRPQSGWSPSAGNGARFWAQEGPRNNGLWSPDVPAGPLAFWDWSLFQKLYRVQSANRAAVSDSQIRSWEACTRTFSCSLLGEGSLCFSQLGCILDGGIVRGVRHGHKLEYNILSVQGKHQEKVAEGVNEPSKRHSLGQTPRWSTHNTEATQPGGQYFNMNLECWTKYARRACASKTPSGRSAQQPRSAEQGRSAWEPAAAAAEEEAAEGPRTWRGKQARRKARRAHTKHQKLRSWAARRPGGQCGGVRLPAYQTVGSR